MNTIRVNSREARTKWRDLLDTIQNSENEIIIERYGKPVGKLVSYQEEPETEGQPTALKEAAVAYQTAVFNPMTPNLRTQLKAQLETVPAHALEAVKQFLQLINQSTAVAQSHSLQPLEVAQAEQWIGLLAGGYEGDALQDSESLYD